MSEEIVADLVFDFSSGIEHELSRVEAKHASNEGKPEENPTSPDHDFGRDARIDQAINRSANHHGDRVKDHRVDHDRDEPEKVVAPVPSQIEGEPSQCVPHGRFTDRFYFDRFSRRAHRPILAASHSRSQSKNQPKSAT